MMMSKMIASRSLQRLCTKTMGDPNKVIAVRSFAAFDTFKSKEKVEEDLFIREQEKAWFEKRKAELAAHEHEEYQQKIAPAMAEAQEALKKVGDKISDAGLEALARWKLQL